MSDDMYPGMTIERTTHYIELCGGVVNLQDTGSSDWKRLFILTKEGVSIGRVSFYKGKVGGFKSYKRDYQDTIDETDMIFIPLGKMMGGGVQVTREKILELWEEAKVFCKNDLKEKQEWRKANPRFNRHGQPASRPKLTGRNPRTVLIGMVWEL